MPITNLLTQNKIKTSAKTQIPGPQIPGPQIPGPQIPGSQIPGPQIPGPTQTKSPSFGSQFVDSMVSGFGMGTGNSLARKMFEPTKISEPTIISEPVNPNLSVPTQSSILSLDDIFKKYEECLEHNEPTQNCEKLLIKQVRSL